MRALVTGAAGFIGSHLTERLLNDGHDVVALDSFTDYYERWIKERNAAAFRDHARCRFIESDLNTLDLPSLVGEVDTIFHLAARAGVRSSWGSTFDGYLQDNMLATQRLLEAVKTAPGAKIVFASSSSIYGDAEAYPTPESTQPLPISPYGVTKEACEHLCRLYWTRFQVPVVSLRFFTVYGPRQRPDMAFHIFGRALLNDRQIEVFGDGEQSREFTYVGDVVDGIVRAGERGTPGGVYNIGGGSETSLNYAISRLISLSGHSVPVVHTASKAGDARRTAADTSLARRDLGFEPSTSLDEGLAQELHWLEALLASERLTGSGSRARP